MLQQTRVDVVIPYYLRFLRRFPTLRSLAVAPLDAVLAHWSGLGYYARARNLHRAAQSVLHDHAGQLPSTAAALATLPGFGPYTSAAVSSLAFNEQVALVDGNVARVLSRLFRLPGDATQARTASWRLAPSLLPLGQAGSFNEALMELGATLCTPRSPSCSSCPVASSCATRPHGDAESFPSPKPRKPRPILHWSSVALFRPDGAVLLARRPEGSLFQGLWDLPSAEAAGSGHGGGGEVAAARRALRDLCTAAGRPAPALNLRFVGRVAQTLTHRELRVSIYAAEVSAGRAGFGSDPDVRWVQRGRHSSLGVSSLARKCLLAAAPGPAAVRTRRRRLSPPPGG